MKKIKIILALCLIVSMAKSQSYFGATSYPHANSVLNSGMATNLTAGFLMAGYESTNTNAGYNFTIDKMDAGGLPGGPPNSFQKGYQIFGNNLCGGFPQIYNCWGIDAIESTGYSPYAITGAANIGCFFAKLDNTGAVLQKALYIFPGGISPQSWSKPIIKESPTIPNQYYIVGAYNGAMYMLSLDSTGAIISQYVTNITSTHYLEPFDIIESPYGSNPLTIVGVSSNNTTGLDGFFYQIPNSLPTTGPTVFKTFDISNGSNNDNEFNSIVISQSGGGGSNGFLIGGLSVSSNPNFPGKSWMLKLDPTGTLVWNTIIEGITDNVNGKAWAVVERLSTFNLIYENYGACANNSGITVYKLDDLGIPFNVNYGGQDEFVFNTGSSGATAPVAMTFNNTGSATDEGLHVFGNLDNTSAGNHYFVESYFNGFEGCNSPLNIFAYDNASSPATNNPTNLQGANLTFCSVFNITSANLTSYNSICGPYPSVNGGSNNKATSTGIKSETNHTSLASVTPNPTNEKITFSCNLTEKANLKLELYNCFGQLVKKIDNESELNSGLYQFEINFNNLNIPYGVYFLKTNNNKKISNYKIIYAKD